MSPILTLRHAQKPIGRGLESAPAGLSALFALTVGKFAEAMHKALPKKRKLPIGQPPETEGVKTTP